MHLLSSIATMLAHAFNTPTKVIEFGCTPCIYRNSSNAFCPWPHFTWPNIMVVQETTFWDGIFLNTLQTSSMFPHFAYMSTKLSPTKTSNSQPFWLICSWTCLPSLSAYNRAHTLTTWIKVNLLGLVPFRSICWKNYSAFSSCPSFTYVLSFLFHAKMCNCTMLGAIATILAATHGGLHWSSSHNASSVFLCLKSRYLWFAYNQKCKLHGLAIYSPHLRHKCF
jgi:hypothetical protein